ncbi:MAG: hypothetical protein WCP79_15450 [Bacillota bacterium]
MAVFQSDNVNRFFRSAVSINYDQIDSVAKQIAARIAASTNKGELKYIFVNAAAPDVFQILLRLNYLLTSAGVITNYRRKFLDVAALCSDCVNILPHGNSADVLAAKADKTLQGFVVMPALQTFDGDFAFLNYEVINIAPVVSPMLLDCDDKLMRLARLCQNYGGALPYELAARIMGVDEDSLGELICGDLMLFEDNDIPALYVVDRKFRAMGFDGELLNEIVENCQPGQQTENQLALRLLCSSALESGYAFFRISKEHISHFANTASGAIEQQTWKRVADDISKLWANPLATNVELSVVPKDALTLYTMLNNDRLTVAARIREFTESLVPLFNSRENILLASDTVKYALQVFSNNNTLLAWRSICAAASGNQAGAMKIINEYSCESALWRVARFTLALTQGNKTTLLEVFDAAIEQLSDRSLTEFLKYSQVVSRHRNANLAGQIAVLYERLCAVKTASERKLVNQIDFSTRRNFSKIVRETLAA